VFLVLAERIMMVGWQRILGRLVLGWAACVAPVFVAVAILGVGVTPAAAQEPKGALRQLVQFNNYSIALHENQHIYRCTGEIPRIEPGKTSYDAYESYPGKYPPVKMVTSKQGVYTAFNTASSWTSIYLNTSGNRATNGEIVYNAGSVLTDLVVHPSDTKPDGIIAIFNEGLGGVYYSPDGNNLGGGGQTILAYPANKYRITAMVAANGGIYTAFKFASTKTAVYFSADGKAVGSGEKVYVGDYDVTRMLVLPGKGVGGADAILTEFAGGKGGVYYSPDGKNLGGAGQTTVAYPANNYEITTMVHANGGVYTVFAGRYVYFSADGKILGGGANCSSIYSGYKDPAGSRIIKGLHVERGTGVGGGDSMITSVTDGEVFVEYKSKDGRNLTTGASTYAINVQAALDSDDWYKIDQMGLSRDQLDSVEYSEGQDQGARYQAMLYGYDGFTLDPVKLEIRAKPGQISSKYIFDVDYTDSVRYGDIGSIAPSPFIKDTRDWEVSATEGKVCFNQQQAESELRASVSVEAGYAGYSGGVEGRYSSSNLSGSSSREVRIVGRGFRSKYFLVLDKPRIKLSDDFRSTVLRGSTEEFRRAFGTHYPVAILFGTLKFTNKKVDEESFTKQVSQSWGATVSGSGSVMGVSVAASASVDQSKSSSSSGSTESSKEGERNFGSDENPIPLRAILRPNYELIRPELFPGKDPAKVLQLRKKYKDAYVAYANTFRPQGINPDPFIAGIDGVNQKNGRPIVFTFTKSHANDKITFCFITRSGQRVELEKYDSTQEFHPNFFMRASGMTRSVMT
jgi:hypothetical protein